MTKCPRITSHDLFFRSPHTKVHIHFKTLWFNLSHFYKEMMYRKVSNAYHYTHYYKGVYKSLSWTIKTLRFVEGLLTKVLFLNPSRRESIKPRRRGFLSYSGRHLQYYNLRLRWLPRTIQSPISRETVLFTRSIVRFERVPTTSVVRSSCAYKFN